MTDHDPLCPMALSRRAKRCTCMELHKRDTRARADERRIQHDGRECVCARTEADTEVNLRERIAQEIEAQKHDIEWPEFHYESGLIAGLERAARIARGGESDE